MFPTRSVLRNIAGILLATERMPHRTITTSLARFRGSYYDILGIAPSATQSDIKAAYYKLSMIYHPDKNQESEVAVEKFRDITQAYEVLGNFKLRRLYDKGIIHTASSQYAQAHPDIEDEEKPDDAQTKFYKAHMKKSKVPHATGRTPIYDFDEWSRAHYGSTFDRRQAAKVRFDERTEKRRTDVLHSEREFLLFGTAIFITCFIVMLSHEAVLDVINETKPTVVNDDKEAIVPVSNATGKS